MCVSSTLQGSSFSESPDLLCERPPSHTRSFSSEKILQEFRELQRAGQAAAAAHSQGQGQLLGQAVSAVSSVIVPCSETWLLIARLQSVACKQAIGYVT